jgi:hypothetical protein
MADRHKYWPHSAPCTKYRADYFSAIDEFRPCATLDARLLIGANEAVDKLDLDCLVEHLHTTIPDPAKLVARELLGRMLCGIAFVFFVTATHLDQCPRRMAVEGRMSFDYVRVSAQRRDGRGERARERGDISYSEWELASTKKMSFNFPDRVLGQVFADFGNDPFLDIGVS